VLTGLGYLADTAKRITFSFPSSSSATILAKESAGHNSVSRNSFAGGFAMRLLCAFLMVGLSLALFNGAEAQDKKKEVTLKGTITCPKCDLGTEEKCFTVIVVKDEDKKEKIYYFDAAAHKKHHAKICNSAEKGTVVGTVSKDGKKLVVTVKSVKFE
jgi:hypothetical protein